MRRVKVGGTVIEEVPGEKVKSWPHEPDRKILVDGKPMSMAAVGYIARWFYENEDRLYCLPQHEGGKKFLKFLDSCILGDIEAAVARLDGEVRRAQ